MGRISEAVATLEKVIELASDSQIAVDAQKRIKNLQ
jgi:hypothetical protein